MALNTKAFTKMPWYYQVLIVGLVCGLLLGAEWYWYLTPVEAEITTKTGQLTDLQAQIAKSTAQMKIYEQFKADTETLGKRLEALKAVLPLEKETPEIMRTVQSNASTSGLRVLRMNVRPIIDREIYTEWPWDFEIVGTYNNVGAFLDKVRLLPRIVNISNLKLSSRASEGEQSFTASVGATFQATTFIYREEQMATAAPAPKPAR
jgi:type IV pilus assembly protein PilO